MKRVTVFAKPQDSERIEKTLDGLVYYREVVENAVKYVAYVPDELTDEIVDKLRNSIDLRYRESSIAVESQDFVISSALKRMDKKRISGGKPPVERLISSAKKYSRIDPLYLLLTTIAGLIAMTGLFLNNVAIIIGAMLLSPLLGPIYSFAINIAVGRAEDAGRSVGNILLSLISVMLLSFILTFLLSLFYPLRLTPEIMLRFDTNPIYLLMAFLLGFAAILALYKGISESIAGIAIAAALLPPAVVVGISLCLSPGDALKPFMMTLENLLGLLAGALVAIPALRIGPRYYYEREKARMYMVRVAAVIAILGAIILLLSLLGA